ncbi:MAG: hypothetical protein AAGD07_01545 [Planctomycetota bacterium]
MRGSWLHLTDTQRARASECISFMRRGIPERRAYRLTGAEPAHVALLGCNRGPAFIPTPEEIAAECKRLLAARPPMPERASDPPSDGAGVHRVTVTHYAAWTNCHSRMTVSRPLGFGWAGVLASRPR